MATMELQILVLFSFLTWLIIMLACIKVYRLFNEFERFKSRNDAELNSSVWHLKRIDETGTELITELKRTNRLLYDVFKDGKPRVEAEPEQHVEYMEEDILRHRKEPEPAVMHMQNLSHRRTDADLLEETHRKRLERFGNIKDQV